MKLSQKRWRLLGTVAAVAVTTTAGGVAWATSNADPTPSPSASPSSPATPGQQQKPDGPGRGGFGPRGEFGLGGALHGEFVVPKDGGGYQTVATQRGEVTAVSKESITVKSADGYSRTYTLTEDTLVNAARDGIDDVKTGNTVSVTAVVTDGKATASSVNDGTVRDAAGQKWGFKHGPR
ncbi:hypothetical protein [Kribbella speibonae]|uniref:DUF5666 domain-containing protein n=1 Tax=Kribbella speibonae TaxID=1572660 RepID=A0A4R0IJW4_9ACTN|nr:hypothetical protein [Kribbella speibonae]TCC25219.1 hypothetical protein E0H58_13710 [Kribbella speibonae]TCC33039.1 hypothetical protein E0H92_33315 [Kribbella speibonae]